MSSFSPETDHGTRQLVEELHRTRARLEALEQDSAEAQRDFDLFFNLMPYLACVVSTDGYFKKVNAAWETTLGYAREEVLRTPMLDFVHPDDLERTVQEIARQGPEYRTKHFINRYRCKNGSYRLFEWTTTFNRDTSTRFGVARDITEQRQSEESLRESEERFRIMADSCPTIIWVTDAEGRTRLANRMCREFFSDTIEQAGLAELRQLLHPEDREEYTNRFLLAVKEKSPFRAEARVLRSDGEWRWISSYAEPRLSASGEFLGHVGISPDITDRKLTEAALQRAKDSAETANRSKSEFLANMSHEIRTPMNGIIGLTDLLLDTDLQPEQRGYLEIVRGSADSLLRILNDILDFSKMEAGKLEFELIEFDLRHTVEAMLKALSIRASSKGLQLTCHLGSDVPAKVLGDPGRLRQILVNLIGNAIKFTERGAIVVRVACLSQTRDAVDLEFTVQDTGIGIPASKRQDIFSAFTQADSSLTRTFGGTGLGLTISSQLVEMMGGRIWLESEEGRGSTFHFTVKLGMASAARPNETVRAAHSSPEEPCQPLRVLVVEDNSVNRLVATRLLQNHHHVVESATNGQEALAMIENHSFDCVLMDVQMPVLDGLQATEAIRCRELVSGGHLPIIAMTAHAMAGDLERCLAAGMDDYISKPIKGADVVATIKRVVKAQKTVRA